MALTAMANRNETVVSLMREIVCLGKETPVSFGESDVQRKIYRDGLLGAFSAGWRESGARKMKGGGHMS
jgi:hypothetical protein